MPCLEAGNQQIGAQNITFSAFNQSSNTKRKQSDSCKSQIEIPAKRSFNQESINNIAGHHPQEQHQYWMGNAAYGIQEQGNNDTSALVEMYAPSAATGWYAQEPPTNEQCAINYTPPDTTQIVPTPQENTDSWENYSKQWNQYYQQMHQNQQQNNLVSRNAEKAQFPQPPQPPPSGADSESWKAYCNAMAKYWSHWGSQVEQKTESKSRRK